MLTLHQSPADHFLHIISGGSYISQIDVIIAMWETRKMRLKYRRKLMSGQGFKLKQCESKLALFLPCLPTSASRSSFRIVLKFIHHKNQLQFPENIHIKEKLTAHLKKEGNYIHQQRWRDGSWWKIISHPPDLNLPDLVDVLENVCKSHQISLQELSHPKV